jgi:acyl carrier protein
MTRNEFLSEMDDLLELPSGTLQGPEKLEDLENWNSTALISFIALADTNNGTVVSHRQILGCRTVADLLAVARIQEAA